MKRFSLVSLLVALLILGALIQSVVRGQLPLTIARLYFNLLLAGTGFFALTILPAVWSRKLGRSEANPATVAGFIANRIAGPLPSVYMLVEYRLQLVGHVIFLLCLHITISLGLLAAVVYYYFRPNRIPATTPVSQTP